MDLSTCLHDARRYLDQIDRLHLKYGSRHRLFDLEQDGVTLASICLSRKKVARILAETVGDGRYELEPAQAKTVILNGKPRLFYRLRLTDLIVHGVVATLINERMQPQLSSRLYSYQKGQHWWKAVADFARYLRDHRRSRPDPKTRGLYVLRRDIEKYTDSIPVGNQSGVWSRLKHLLGLDPQHDQRSCQYWNLIQHVVRPETYSEDGFLYCNVLGVPTGSPISTTLFNLYLMPLDHALATLSGAFYARYSDDILFAHSDPAVVQEASGRLESILRQLELSTNKSKDENFFFNGAGRPSAIWVTARGTTQIPFLGCNVSFNGTVSLKGKKVRQLLSDVKLRVQRTLRALPGKDPDSTGPVVCSVVNQALDPACLCRHKTALLLRGVVTSRPQLQEIDYHLARIVAGALSGDSSVRAFRQIAYRTLRQEWNLISLFHQRNID